MGAMSRMQALGRMKAGAITETERIHGGKLTVERLRELIDYDAVTGAITWRVRRGAIKAGSLAGTRHAHGYIQISVDGSVYLAHRLAWLWVTGEWPADDIDHINGIKNDNRIENLRAATRLVNMQNFRRARKDSASGLLGTSPNNGRWQAKIQINGRTKYIGTFDTAEEAHSAYIEEKRKLHTGCTL